MQLARLSTFAAPARFTAAAAVALPWLWTTTLLLAVAGLYAGFFIAPSDATQGEAHRIMFIHVPSAWMAMLIYLVMAFWAIWGWAMKVRLASMYARALAPTGALMTVLSLVTGALWGQPTWGTWWVWDARLTSQFILLLLYLGFIALVGAIEEQRRADHAAALLVGVGVVNIPIIYFSVRWWNTLHQGASISAGAAPTMAAATFGALALMTLAFWAYTFAAVITRARAIVLEQEGDRTWVTAALQR